MRSNTLRAMPISQLRSADQRYIGQRLRVAGFVGQSAPTVFPIQTADGTVEVHQFQVVDGKSTILVNYRDALPDTFRLGGPVQVDGVYAAPGQMQADHVLTKCPSKYQSEQVYKRHQAAQKT